MAYLDRVFENAAETVIIPNNVVFSGNMTVGGSLTITGPLTPEGSITLNAGDNIVITKGYLTLGASANVSGSGYALTASLTKAIGIYADDAGVLYGAGAVRAGVFRNLVTISHSNETSIFGVQGQLKIKAPLDCVLTSGNRAGTWNYLEMGGTLTKTITLSGTDKATAGAFAMVDWDGVGSLTLSSGHVLAGFAALTNVTKTGGTFTETGTFAAFAALNNSTASYSPFAVGLYLPAGTTTMAVNANCSVMGATGRIAKLFGTSAAANLGDGYGAVEVDLTLTGTVAGPVAALSAWVNMAASSSGGGNVICAQDNGIYVPATGTPMSASTAIIGMRMQYVVDGGGDAGALHLFDTNIYDNVLTSLFRVNAIVDMGGSTGAATGNDYKIPLFRDVTAGQTWYVNIYHT